MFWILCYFSCFLFDIYLLLIIALLNNKGAMMDGNCHVKCTREIRGNGLSWKVAFDLLQFYNKQMNSGISLFVGLTPTSRRWLRSGHMGPRAQSPLSNLFTFVLCRIQIKTNFFPYKHNSKKNM